MRPDEIHVLKTYLDNKNILQLKQFIAHGNVSIYEHSLMVAKLSLWINYKLRLDANTESLIKVTMLHDYYLYDWHQKGHGKLHGFTHPHIARVNAEKDFMLTEKEKRAIEAHMWPMNIQTFPNSKEAWILCFADKCSALYETIFMRHSS